MNFILGTAGHIDHGKTSLVKALTGIDTDRLKEEKKRGITIELGFAYLDLPCNTRLGIVDVPGHERFIHTMLAGADGIDIAMLIIAADEGIMPQTMEHFGILSLLDIKHGIIVLTKIDLVDNDWLEMLKEEIADKFEGSFLEQAPIIPVSSHSGEGLELLKNTLSQIVSVLDEKRISVPFRLPIDRVFSMDGFGTVVTGTLIEGCMKEKQDVMLYPTEERAKIRSLQVHGEACEIAYAGQRVAVNLSGIKKHQVQRGFCIGDIDSMENTMMLDVKLTILPDTERVIKNGSRFHFHHGTSESLCKLILLDRDEIKANESAYAQLRLENKIALKISDHFVIRFYSPLETIGGGIVLDANPIKHRRNQPDVISGLEIRENGTVKQKVQQAIFENSRFLKDIDLIKRSVGCDKINSELNQLVKEKSIVKLDEKLYLSAEYLNSLKNNLSETLKEYHKQNPLKEGMNREETRNKLIKNASGNITDSILDYFLAENIIKNVNGFICLPEFKIVVNNSQAKIIDSLEKLYLDAGFAPPSNDEAIKAYIKDKNQFQACLSSLKASGTIISLDLQYCMHKNSYEHALNILKDFMQQNADITLAQYRDLLGVSRKYAVALLEYFDKIKITKKIGDKRILYR